MFLAETPAFKCRLWIWA